MSERQSRESNELNWRASHLEIPKPSEGSLSQPDSCGTAALGGVLPPCSFVTSAVKVLVCPVTRDVLDLHEDAEEKQIDQPRMHANWREFNSRDLDSRCFALIRGQS